MTAAASNKLFDCLFEPCSQAANAVDKQNHYLEFAWCNSRDCFQVSVFNLFVPIMAMVLHFCTAILWSLSFPMQVSSCSRYLWRSKRWSINMFSCILCCILWFVGLLKNHWRRRGPCWIIWFAMFHSGCQRSIYRPETTGRSHAWAWSKRPTVITPSSNRRPDESASYHPTNGAPARHGGWFDHSGMGRTATIAQLIDVALSGKILWDLSWLMPLSHWSLWEPIQLETWSLFNGGPTDCPSRVTVVTSHRQSSLYPKFSLSGLNV